MLGAVALDICLNPLFIFGGGPIPRLGIAGSATATLLGQSITVIALVLYLYKTHHFLCFHRADLRFLHLDRTILRSLVLKGLPMGLQMILVSLSLIIMISLVNTFGSQFSAAYGACLQLWNYVQMPAMAVGMSVSSMASQNVGAGRWDRVSKVALAGVLFNLVMTGALVLLVHLLQAPILGIFLPDAASISLAKHINTVVGWSFILFGVSFVISGVVRSTGAVIAPLLMLFISLWLVRVPFAIELLPYWHEDAVWWSFPAGSAVSMILSISYYKWGGWRKASIIPDTNETAIPSPKPSLSEP
jgi:putative MATE family efflux protein